MGDRPEHDVWKSRTLSLRQDIANLVEKDFPPEAILDLVDDYLLQWFDIIPGDKVGDSYIPLDKPA